MVKYSRKPLKVEAFQWPEMKITDTTLPSFPGWLVAVIRDHKARMPETDSSAHLKIIVTTDGDTEHWVYPTNWIVQHTDGILSVYTNKEFLLEYNVEA